MSVPRMPVPGGAETMEPGTCWSHSVAKIANPGSGRDLVSKIKVQSNGDRCPKLASSQACTGEYTNTPKHTHTQRETQEQMEKLKTKPK